MNEAHYQWHSLTAGRFILVHNKALTFEKRGLQNQFTVCSIWVSKRCKKYFIFPISILGQNFLFVRRGQSDDLMSYQIMHRGEWMTYDGHILGECSHLNLNSLVW